LHYLTSIKRAGRVYPAFDPLFARVMKDASNIDDEEDKFAILDLIKDVHRTHLN